MGVGSFFKSKYESYKKEKAYEQAASSQIRVKAKAAYWRSREKAEQAEAASMARRDARAKYAPKPKRSATSIFSSMSQISSPSVGIRRTISRKRVVPTVVVKKRKRSKRRSVPRIIVKKRRRSKKIPQSLGYSWGTFGR